MASHLLSALYTEVISDEQVQKGFAEVVLSVEDLQLDVPDAVDETAAFVARAVVDDVLPPSFVRRLPTSELDSPFATGVGTCHSARGLCWMMCCCRPLC